MSIQKLAILIFSLGCSLLSAQNIHLWDGETNDDLLCQTNSYFKINDTEPYSGSSCLEARFDNWNGAQLQLGDCSYYRENINYAQFLCFQVKANIPGTTLHLTLGAWHSSDNSRSPRIDITPFVIDEEVTENYKLACVPLEAFRDGTFTALWLESLIFAVDSPDPNLRVYIDELILIDKVPTAATKIDPIASHSIRVHFDSRYNPMSATDLVNYHLTSNQDPLFLNPVFPKDIGIHHYYDGLESDSMWLALPKAHFTVILIFDEKMKAGRTYELSIENVTDPASNRSEPADFSFLYNDEKINGSIKVNQIGYLLKSKKYAYVGNYAGTAGMLEMSPTIFELRTADTGETVFSGQTSFRANDLELSGEHLFECNFSTFETPGNYYIFVPGIGRSYDFEIKEDVYNDLLLTAAKGLFMSRCGMELQAEHAGSYARPSCHQNDCLIHSSIQNTETYGGETIGAPHEVIGGWHDAGDYSRPLSNQLLVAGQLLNAYESFPDKYQNNWNLPGSDNDMPDILDEVKWGLDFLLKMQSTDGGVFYKIASTGYPRALPQSDQEQYYLSAKTTHITGAYAAVMAKAARIYKPYLPDFAQTCLEQAEQAWQFLELHTQATPFFGYVDNLLDSDLSCGQTPDDEGDYDERAWAAVELYRTTGEAKYHDDFVSNWSQNTPFFGWNATKHSQKRASLSYYQISELPTDDAIRKTILDAVVLDAEAIKSRTLTNPYRGEYRSDVLQFIGWGNYNQSTTHAATLLQAYFVSGDESYLDAARLNLDPQLGNNPLSQSYITGVGDNPVVNPIHYPSELDGIEEPIPGIPVFGAHHRAEWQYQSFITPKITQPLFYDPDSLAPEYPTLRRYFDQQRVFSMNEFTIGENMADLIYTIGYFSNFDTTSSLLKITDAEVSIYPNPSSNRIQFKLPTGENYQFKVFNTNGQLLNSKIISEDSTVDIEGLPAGIYYIKINHSESKTTYTEKLVKLD